MSAKPITENTLFYGDNLFILREHIPSESIDLIYLDPPFNSSHIRDLKGTLQREQAAIGIYIKLETPTRDMNTESVSAGFYHSPGWNKDYPRIQILTIDELLHNAEVKMPPQFGTFKQAPRVQQADAEQAEFGFG